MKLYVKRKEDNTVFPVWKYVDNGDNITVWCKEWYGAQVIGKDCEFHTQPSGYQYRESDFPTCKHEKLIKSGESAKCECNKYFGWWCKSSPDNACHYYSHEKDGDYYITLANKKEYKLPNYDEASHEDEEEDWCIFCGQPDERK